MGLVKSILVVCRDKNLSEIVYFCLEGWGYEVEVLNEENISLSHIKKKEPHLIIIDFPSSFKDSLDLCQQIKDDFITKSVPVIVLINKRQLRKYLLTLKQGIDDYLLKPPDPLDLRVRVEMALRRTQHGFYTNSLTHLAGGRIIEEILKEKLSKNEKFAFAHIDIDNFKYFNDKYGYIKGDKVITQTAYILYQAIAQLGKREDFVGHIGGDDFVFITMPERGKLIASEFIYQFDRLIPLHYPAQIRNRGYIEVEDRAGEVRKIPLMSVSVALVNNKQCDFDNVVQINEALAALKSYLKKIPGSKFMIERRRNNQGRERRISDQAAYKAHHAVSQKTNILPLGQILIEKGLITPDALDKSLDIHWRRGLPLGEILKDSNLLDEEKLQEILLWQNRP